MVSSSICRVDPFGRSKVSRRCRGLLRLSDLRVMLLALWDRRASRGLKL